MEFNINGVLRPEEEYKNNYEGYIIKNKGFGGNKNQIFTNENTYNSETIFNVQRHINLFQNGKK